MSTAA